MIYFLLSAAILLNLCVCVCVCVCATRCFAYLLASPALPAKGIPKLRVRDATFTAKAQETDFVYLDTSTKEPVTRSAVFAESAAETRLATEVAAHAVNGNAGEAVPAIVDTRIHNVSRVP
jgi:hypothetical protein